MTDFKSYAFQNLSEEEIEKYAKQYEGIDMAKHIGADEDNFPFVIENEDMKMTMFWNKYSGMLAHLDEDSVSAYATVKYLKETAYPVLKSIKEAEKYAKDQEWPKKERE